MQPSDVSLITGERVNIIIIIIIIITSLPQLNEQFGRVYILSYFITWENSMKSTGGRTPISSLCHNTS